MKRIISGKLARSAKLLSTASKFAVNEIRKKIQDPSLVNPEYLALLQINEFVKALDSLKGFPMKIGQLLSLDTTGMIPPQVREILEKLQNKATSVDHAQMRQVFLQQLGEKAGELEVDWRSIASASIGQVYLAKIKQTQQEIVLKIQYPEIEHSLEGDMFLLKKLTPVMSKLTGRQVDLTELFNELSVMFKMEIDYEREASMLEKYSALTQENTFLKVPKVFKEYSAKKIVAMEYISGRTFTDWFKDNPPMEQKRQIAHEMIELFFHELFKWRLVQTDPNFANFLIAEDGRLILLDFGATMEYSPEFVVKYRSLLQALFVQDRTRVIQESIDFELLDARESEEAKEAYYKMVMVAVGPFLSTSRFSFGSTDYAEQSKLTALSFVKAAKFTPPPRHLLFLHRKLGGLYSLLQRLNVDIELGTYWKRWIEKLD